MIVFPEKDCVGCTACESICKRKVILMESDEEGFQRPIISDSKLCVECGECERVCPVINGQPENKRVDIGYIVQNTNESIRRESTSGGAFSAIATSVIKESGVVYGVAYDEDLKVKHVAIKDESELGRLRNSKYVQSDLSGIFQDVKANIEEGKHVCFSGTPCQIEGLKCYLGKDYDNLLLIDVVCHGVSSPLIWQKYIDTIREYLPGKIYFRWKHYGYKYSTMSVFDRDGKEVYFEGVETDKMLRAYFTNNCDRESCYDCKFKKRYRNADITIWDCFQPKYFNKDFDDDLGTSSVLINSEVGKKRFEIIEQMGVLKTFRVDADDLTFGNNEMIASVKRGPYRDTILVDAASMNSEDLFEKYFPNTVIGRIKKLGRVLLVKTGLYNRLKYRLYLYRRSKTK